MLSVLDPMFGCFQLDFLQTDCLLKVYISGLQTFLSDGHISYYTTVRGSDSIRSVIVSGCVTFCQIQKIFVNVSFFHY